MLMLELAISPFLFQLSPAVVRATDPKKLFVSIRKPTIITHIITVHIIGKVGRQSVEWPQWHKTVISRRTIVCHADI